MAVYTPVEAAQLRDFLQAYDLGDAISFKGIAEGVENSNFYLETELSGTRRAFILTLYEKRAPLAELPFFIGLMQHLVRANFPCPQPIAARNGETLLTLNGRQAAIVSFLPGLSVDPPLVTHCQQLGGALADLHVAASDFPQTRINRLGPEFWAQTAPLLGKQAQQLGAHQTLNASLRAIEPHWPQDLPRGIIHADLFPDNVFFREQHFAAAIDFYFACTDFWAYDLAIVLNAWAMDRQARWHPKKASAILAAYHAKRPLSEHEMHALPILCLGAALRFFLTRLHDWHATQAGALVKAKDPREYSAKMSYFLARLDSGLDLADFWS